VSRDHGTARPNRKQVQDAPECSRKAAEECSARRKPWVDERKLQQAPKGAKRKCLARVPTLLPLPQVVYHPAHHRSPVRPRNSRQKREKRSINLCPRRLHRADKIRRKLRQRNENAYRHHPAPGPTRPHHSKKNAGSHYQQRREQQIIDNNIRPPRPDAADRSEQIEKRIAFEVFIQVSKSTIINICKIPSRFSAPATRHRPF